MWEPIAEIKGGPRPVASHQLNPCCLEDGQAVARQRRRSNPEIPKLDPHQPWADATQESPKKTGALNIDPNTIDQTQRETDMGEAPRDEAPLAGGGAFGLAKAAWAASRKRGEGLLFGCPCNKNPPY